MCIIKHNQKKLSSDSSFLFLEVFNKPLSCKFNRSGYNKALIWTGKLN